MGWITLSLRRNELQTSITDMQAELLQLSRKRRQLSNFANAVADGRITPSEIGSIGLDLFGDATDFMGYSHDAATQVADEMTGLYEERYGNVTQQQYMNNPAVANQASLYFDENQNLDLAAINADLYEQALEDYVNTVVSPKLQELEKDLDAKQTRIEADLQSKEAELQTVKESITKNINSSTIKL